MPTLYLVRHASPDWNRKDIPYHLPPGPPLTTQGLAEAEALGRFLRMAGVRQILTSPLERCRHTAEIAAHITGAAVEVVEDLREWQPQEPRDALRARLWPVLERTWRAQDGTGNPAALITHGMPIMVLLSALGIDDRSMERLRVYDHRNPVPPAGAWEASRNGGDEWQLHLAFTPEAVLA